MPFDNRTVYKGELIYPTDGKGILIGKQGASFQGFFDLQCVRKILNLRAGDKVVVVCLRKYREGNSLPDGRDRPITVNEVHSITFCSVNCLLC